jgi:Fe-S cluster biogenesis protein NfuA
MSEPVKRPPVTLYAESTPNPLTMRYVCDRLLVQDGRLLEFRTPEETVGVSPLAEHVFNLPFVTGVFISSNFISVTRNTSITWDLVQLELREYIQEFLNTDGRVVYEDAPAQALADANERASSHADARGPEDEKIIRVLEEYIRPAVEGDGGHIAFRSFEEGVVTVSLRGSCSGCPSSMVTLKQGIENLLKHEVPGVREVVAEEALSVKLCSLGVRPFHPSATDPVCWWFSDHYGDPAHSSFVDRMRSAHVPHPSGNERRCATR